MNIYHTIDDFVKLPNAIVTSGTFDGVHLGHQRILQRLAEIAAKYGGETVVITFWPHPRLVLNTFEEKAELLKAQGVSHLLRIPFTKEFAQLSSQQFIEQVLVHKIGTTKLVIGYDHRFGKNREGSFEQLKMNGPHYGFDVEEIPRHEVDHVGVSSTKIRKALAEGDIETATHFLGRPYAISGRVIKGEKLGRVLGFPTANIDVDSHYKLIPAEGIYGVRVIYAGTPYDGMLYIGNRPTVGGSKRSIEVNIFDFDKEVYGEALTVELVASIRKDERFADLEALKTQLQLDKESALRLLR